MKTTTANKITIVSLAWMLITCLVLSISSCTTASKGYNYKAHSSKNAKFKKNNENGNYMKCKRKY